MAKRLLFCAFALTVFLCSGLYGMELTETKSFGNGILEMPVTVEVDGKYCYVMDSSTGSMNQLSLDGKWIRAIDGRGQGQGKLANPFGFHVEAGILL